jgi:hypothetical protein
MDTEYQIFHLDNFIESYAKMLGKPVIYFRTYGWNNSSNVEKINESMEIYKDLLPLDIFDTMKNTEFLFVEVDEIHKAEEFLLDNFPKSQSDVGYPELYIHFSLCNELGQIILSN